MLCEEAREFFTSFSQGELTPEEEQAFREHLAACQHCSEELSEVEAALTALRSLEPMEPPADFAERVMDSLPYRGRLSLGWRPLWALGGAAAAALLFLLGMSLGHIKAEREFVQRPEAVPSETITAPAVTEKPPAVPEASAPTSNRPSPLESAPTKAAPGVQPVPSAPAGTPPRTVVPAARRPAGAARGESRARIVNATTPTLGYGGYGYGRVDRLMGVTEGAVPPAAGLRPGGPVTGFPAAAPSVPLPAAAPVESGTAPPAVAEQETTHGGVKGGSAAPSSALTERRFDLDLQGADLNDALRLLANVDRQPIVIGPGVQGKKVTTKMQNVTAKEALARLAKAFDLILEFPPGNIVVKKAGGSSLSPHSNTRWA